MNPPRPNPAPLPQDWSPDQALAAFELTEFIRDQLWDQYGPTIQLALRLRQQPADRDLPALGSPLDNDSPF